MAPTTAQARAGAHRSWARTADRSLRTAPGTAAFLERFEREVDPDGVLTPAERTLRAESAKRAYFTELAIRSARARAAAKRVGGGTSPSGSLVGRPAGDLERGDAA